MAVGRQGVCGIQLPLHTSEGVADYIIAHGFFGFSYRAEVYNWQL
jgi:hypothetical protein